MTEKTRALYDLAMQRILEVLQRINPGGGFAVELAVSDYEEAILGSMEAAFPGARAKGCWFHYGQVN